MKKTILLSSLFAAAAAVAGEVVSSNAVAALNKPIDVKAKQTLLAVPFEGYETSGKVKVADIVKTSDLADGSKLYVPTSDGQYDTWTLDANGQWIPGVNVSVGSDGTVASSETVSAEDRKINRGDAFWLEPVFASGNNTGTVFLLGQGDGTSGTSTVASGWNLVGNASAGDQTGFNVTGTKGDKVIVQLEDGSLRYYTYSDTKKAWRYQDDEGVYQYLNPAIKAGQGLWYYSKDTASKDIQW